MVSATTMRNFLCCLFVICISFANAQENTVKSTNTELKLASMPYYNYGKGIGITSADSSFQVNLKLRMQNRVTYLQRDGEAGAYEGQIRRLRFKVDGYVVNPKFVYVLQLGLSPTDIGKSDDNEYVNIVRDAMLIYRPNKRWSFGFGQTTLPANRQRINSSGALQFTDRSLNDSKFTIESDFGLHFANINQFDDKFSYNFKAGVTTGEGRTYSSSPDKGVALTGRAEIYPFGAFKKNGAYFEGDLMREQTPKVMLSATYSKNNKAQKTQGQLGKQLFDSRTMNSVFLDGIAKYKGWSAMIAYMSRTSDKSAITYNPINSSDIRYVYAGHGTDYQVSYNFPSNYEISGRFSQQKVDTEIFVLTPNRQEYSLGLTRYIWEHAFKLQSEIAFDELNFIDGSQKQNWYIRFQMEIGL